MAFDFTYPTPLPSTKGWGPGWPTCQTDKMVADPLFAPSLHRRISELVSLLVAEMQRRGYHFQDPGCWGFGCRSTKGGSGETPSFHSWGLALDVNAPQNPMNFDDPAAAFAASDIAQHNRWIVRLLKDYGFFWLGRVGDPMHFSFCGNPKDATRMLEKARANLEPRFTVAGKTFQKFSKAARRVKRLLDEGRSKVTVKRR